MRRNPSGLGGREMGLQNEYRDRRHDSFGRTQSCSPPVV